MGGGGQSDYLPKSVTKKDFRCDSVLEIDFKSKEKSPKTIHLKRFLGGIIEI